MNQAKYQSTEQLTQDYPTILDTTMTFTSMESGTMKYSTMVDGQRLTVNAREDSLSNYYYNLVETVSNLMNSATVSIELGSTLLLVETK